MSRFNLPLADVGAGISPADGAKLFFTIAGTSTPLDTFSDEAQTIPNTNPVIADSAGVFPDIWLKTSGRYKVFLKDKNNVQIWEADPVSAVSDVDLASETLTGSSLVGYRNETVEEYLDATDRNYGTVALLVASSPTPGRFYKTGGYSVNGGPGAGRYFCKTAAQASSDGDLIDEVGAGFTAANGNKVIFQTNKTTTIEHYGAVLDLVADCGPAISAMVAGTGRMVARLAGGYENYALGGGHPLTYGVLIATDVETKSFTTYDFGFNQVKLTSGASFTPDTNVETVFTVKAKWKNLNIVDSAGQTFIRKDVTDVDRLYESCSIDDIDINILGNLISADGNFGWFNLSINHIKTIRLDALFKVKDGTGQTGNSVTDALFQSTGTLIDVENATVQCAFDATNIGLNTLTDATASAIIKYTGAIQPASDKVTFSNTSFEYDDITIDTPILRTETGAAMKFIFDKCGVFHRDVVAMNGRGFYPFEINGAGNSIHFTGGTSEWWSRFAGAQGVYLKVNAGTLLDSDWRYEAMDIGTNWDRLGTLRKKFPMANNANVNFTSASYNVENGRLVVVFAGTAAQALSNNDTLFDFPDIATFPLNVTYHGDVTEVRAAASSGSIVLRESGGLNIGDPIECCLMVDLG
jgi:hypothetical protein